jgi:hypothetical protein
MRFRITTKRFAIALGIATGLLISSIGVTGLPPTTLSGLFDSVKTTTFNFFAPNKQSTKIAGGTLIETGNKNLLQNPSFEHSTPETGWTIAPNNPLTETASVPDGLRFLTFSPSAAGFEVSQDSTIGAGAYAEGGAQGYASIKVKVDSADQNVVICPRRAGSIVEDLCVDAVVDGNWNTYAIPFVLGATSNGISVHAEGYVSMTGVISVDDAFVGEGLIPETSLIGPWRSWTLGSFGFTNASGVGRYREVGDSIEAEATITFSGASVFSSGDVGLPPGFTINTSKISSTDGGVGATYLGPSYYRDSGTTANNTAGYVSYFSSTSVIFRRTGGTGISATSPFTWASGDSISFRITVPVNELNGSTNTYTSQCGANCVDSLDVSVDTSGNLSKFNVPGWVTSAALSGTNNQVKTLSVPAGTFTEVPNCQCTVESGATTNDMSCKFNTASSTVTSLLFNTSTNGAASNLPITVSCDKQGADFTATRTIVGSFADLNYVYFAADSNGGQVLSSGDAIPFSTVRQNYGGGSWSGTSYTVPRSGVYRACVHVSFTAAADQRIRFNGALNKFVLLDTSQSVKGGCAEDYLASGQTINFSTQTAGGTLLNNAQLHWITISRLPGQAP